jgi:hypothetical protein
VIRFKYSNTLNHTDTSNYLDFGSKIHEHKQEGDGESEPRWERKPPPFRSDPTGWFPPCGASGTCSSYRRLPIEPKPMTEPARKGP